MNSEEGKRRGSREKAAVFLALLFLLARCSPPQKTRDVVSVVDDLGAKVDVPKRVRRVVSLVPSSSEMVCLLRCARLVGGTRYDRFPKELVERVKEKKIAIVGGGFDPNIEEILKLKPDLVLADGPSQQRALTPLKKAGFPVLSLQPHTTQQLERGFRLISKLLGAEEKAETILKRNREEIRNIQESIQSLPRVKVFLITWSEPLLTAGRASFVEQLIERAGGKNIFGDLPFASGEVSIEWVLKRNPEVMIFVDKQKAYARKIEKERAWQKVDAVKRKRFCFVDGSLLRPTVQYADSVKTLASCFHPKERAE